MSLCLSYKGSSIVFKPVRLCHVSCKQLPMNWLAADFFHAAYRSIHLSSTNLSDIPSHKRRVQDKFSKKLKEIYNYYEEFVGIAEVQNAQDKVKKAEKIFLSTRAEERSTMREVLSVRDKLRHVRERLSHVDYSNPLYPQLANEQHELVTLETKLQKDLDAVEDKERDTFLELSAAMRDSYEKERARVERTKNWSLIGTIIGTLVGMLSSIYINRIRTKDLKEAILNQDHSDSLKHSVDNVIPYTQAQYSDIKDEIRNLQACLINKLIEPPSEKNNSSSAMKNTSISNDKATLESFAKVLHNFQSQLGVLMETSKQDQAKLTSQNDNLHKQIMSLKSAKQMDSKVVDEIFKMSGKLNKINQAIDSSETTSKIVTDAPNGPSKYHFIRDIALWGSVLAALYYIINV